MEHYERNTKNSHLVWVAKFYSRALQDHLWVVLSYPYSLDVERGYLQAKETLQLRRRGKTWRIWPYPFTPPDGQSYYVTKVAASALTQGAVGEIAQARFNLEKVRGNAEA